MDKDKETTRFDIAKFAIVIIVIVILLVVALFIAYKYSQKSSGNIILPGGVTYTGPTLTQTPGNMPIPTPVRFTAPSDGEWDLFGGTIYSYKFSYPKTLPLVVFPGDLSDSVAINWGGIPPQQNVLLNIELIAKRDPKFVKKPKIEYVRNWYTFFDGLKGVAKVEPFTNINGLKGYRASYVNVQNQSPNTDVFFEIPGQSGVMIHMANGILDPEIFDRIVDSLKWTPEKK